MKVCQDESGTNFPGPGAGTDHKGSVNGSLDQSHVLLSRCVVMLYTVLKTASFS